MPTPNYEVGIISNNNVSLNSGLSTPVSDASEGKGSTYSARFVKDKFFSPNPLSNVGSKDIKDWFAEYVGVPGNFSKTKNDNTDISWGSYRGSGILGVKVSTVNETYSKYADNQNAKLFITPICGTVGGVKIEYPGTSVTVANNTAYAVTGINGGGNQQTPATIKFTISQGQVSFQFLWTAAYDTGGQAYIKGTSTCGVNGALYGLPAGDTAVFFGGKQANRNYGITYA